MTSTTTSVVLPVPWTSQLGVNAEGKGEYGQACMLMLLLYYGLTPANTAADTLNDMKPGRMAAHDLIVLGLRFNYRFDMDLIEDASELYYHLELGRPVLLLVNYADLDLPLHLSPGSEQGWYWLVVMGYDGDSFMVHDPSWKAYQRNGCGGAAVRVNAQTLNDALVTIVQNNAIY